MREATVDEQTDCWGSTDNHGHERWRCGAMDLLNSPTDRDLQPFVEILNQNRMPRRIEIGRRIESTAVYAGIRRTNEDILLRYSPDSPMLRYSLRPALRLRFTGDDPSEGTVPEWSGPKLFLIVPEAVEEAVGRELGSKACEPDRRGGSENERPISRSAHRLRNLRLLHELFLATRGPVRDFIEAWQFPPSCWNFFQACRYSPQFRRWAVHHPQLTYLAATNAPLGTFDGPDNEALLDWLTSGSFSRMLIWAGLPAARPLVKILRRIPPPFLGADLRDRLASVARDPRRLAILSHLPAPLFREPVQLLVQNQPRFSLGVVRAVSDIREACSRTIPERDTSSPASRVQHPSELWSTLFSPIVLTIELYKVLSLKERAAFDAKLGKASSFRALRILLGDEENGRLFKHVRFFDGSASVVPIRTVDELVRISKALRNCIRFMLGQYVPGVIEERSQLYLVRSRRRRAILEIMQDNYEERWYVSGFRGSDNMRPPGRLYRVARQWAQTHHIDWPEARD